MLRFLKSKRKAVNPLKKLKFEVQLSEFCQQLTVYCRFNFCQRLTVHGRQPSRGVTGL